MTTATASSSASPVEENKEEKTIVATCQGAVNVFSRDKAVFTHVSYFVIEAMEKCLKKFTLQDVGALAESWSTNGYMSVYSALFERSAHLELQDGFTLPLYAVLPTGQKSELVGNLAIPEATKIHQFLGNDPSRLADLKLAEGWHVRPVNSSFPTYDLYVVAKPSSLNFYDDDAKQEPEAAEVARNDTRTKRKPAATDNAPWKKQKCGTSDVVALAL
jgi:hypothetical protein